MTSLVELKSEVLSDSQSQVEGSRWLIFGGGDHAIKFAQMLLAHKPSQELVILTENPHNIFDISNLEETETQITYGGRLSDLSNWSQQSWS
ncbi:hypothetical protein PN473_00880, partial [Dolichospermum circinale CS-545/17]|nr:hypothetical protein [Dolichospermum circinale CS-545/17]